MENQEINQSTDMPVITAVQPTEVTPINQIAQRPKESGMRGIVVVLLLLVIIGAGVGTGYGISNVIKPSGASGPISGGPGTLSADQIEVGKIYGMDDAKRYPDTSEGVIAKGGIDGEGTHHLLRTGGASQTVYLTSSLLDLDLFAGDKVQIRGETFSAQKAAWFMDVASVKVIELGTEQPAETAVPASE